MTATPGRPAYSRFRILRAYYVASIVLFSYLWLRVSTSSRLLQSKERRLERAHRRNARRIYRAVISLQGLYIKVGQLFSIMANFLPEAFRRELAALQDSVPAHPFTAVDRRIREEFSGKGPDDLFITFEREPLASASIGQVHAATLDGGRRVAVKIQYPDIEAIVRADLATLRRIFALVQRFVDYDGISAIYDDIQDMILQELDFTREADNAERVAAAFEGRTDVYCPKIVRKLSTRRVLTTEFIDGVKVHDYPGLRKLGVDRSDLARRLIEVYCEQIFQHGVYHADPHPGNILVGPDTKLTFIDFGAVGVLAPAMRSGLEHLVKAALKRDTQRITAALHEMGFIAYRADPEICDRVVEYFHVVFQREVQVKGFNLKDIRFDPQKGLENLADLRQMNISLADITNTFHVPRDWILLERTILMVMGLCTELDPDMNPMDIIRPHVERMVLGDEGDWSKFIMDAGREITLSMISLPSEIGKLTRRALDGDLRVRIAAPPEVVTLYYELAQQVIFTALAITSGLLSLRFRMMGERPWSRAFLIGAGCCGLLLLRSMWIGRKLLRRSANRH